MSSKDYKRTTLQAKILGRVERLMGNDCNVNPFPVATKNWVAFREGWLRDLGDPLSHEIRTGGKAHFSRES